MPRSSIQPTPPRPEGGPQVVALGGGHGLHATLSAVRRVAGQVTAVVTVADDGGSSGRIRQEFDVVPPGDLRMALAALCGDDDWGRTWERLVQHRFGGEGALSGHAVGNLLIVGLWELLGDPVAALDLVGELLRAEGRVLPMTTQPLVIHAEVLGEDPERPTEVTHVRGQVQVASSPGRIVDVGLDPADAAACPEAVAAVAEADWIVLGPGSWITSVLPHLLLPQMREAIVARSDRLVVVLNIGEQDEEVAGFTLAEQLAALGRMAPGLQAHTVLIDAAMVPAERRHLEAVVGQLGAELMVADLAVDERTPRHDPHKLAAAVAAIIRPDAWELRGN